MQNKEQGYEKTGVDLSMDVDVSELNDAISVVSTAVTINSNSLEQSIVSFNITPGDPPIEDPSIDVTACDGHVYASAPLSPSYITDVVEPVKIKVFYSLLKGITQVFTDGVVSISLEGNWVVFSSKGSNRAVARIPQALDYEAVVFDRPDHELVQLGEFKHGEIKSVFRRTSWILPKRVLKTSFAGVHFVNSCGYPAAIASDTLGFVEVKLHGFDFKGVTNDIHFSDRLQSAILRLPVESWEPVKIYRSEHVPFFKVESGPYVIYSGGFSGEFPDYSGIVEMRKNEGYVDVVFEKDILVKALQKVSVLMGNANVPYKRAIFNVSNDSCLVTSDSKEVELELSIPFESDSGECVKFKVSVDSFLTGVLMCDSPSIHVAANKKTDSPIFVTGGLDDDYMYIVMGMLIRD